MANSKLGKPTAVFNTLRHCTFECNGSASAGLFMPSRQVKAYRSGHSTLKGMLALCIHGFPMAHGAQDILWLEVEDEYSTSFTLGVSPAYVYQLSELLVTPEVVQQTQHNSFNVVELVASALAMLLELFNWRVVGFSTSPPQPQLLVQRLELWSEQGLAAVVSAEPALLQSIEQQLQRMDTAYQQRWKLLSHAMEVSYRLDLLATKRWWTQSELAQLEVGDALCLLQPQTEGADERYLKTLLRPAHGNAHATLTADLALQGQSFQVVIQSTGMDSMSSTSLHADPSAQSLLLEVVAGTLSLSLADLASLSQGTLLGLDQSALPMVKLVFNGNALFEGELVMCNDTPMIQITQSLVETPQVLVQHGQY